MRRIVLSVIVGLLLISRLDAQGPRRRFLSRVGSGDLNYYVRTDGSNSNTGLLNTAAGAWLTIDKAADTVPPGAVVRVQAGTYAEAITPAVSGTASLPITFVADGTVTFCSMTAANKNYIKVIGFTIDNDAGSCVKTNRAISLTGTSTGWEMWNNTILDANQTGIGHSTNADRHHNFIIIGNVFTAIGPNGSAVSISGHHNIVAYNEVYALDPDAFLIDGTQSYWLNNYVHDPLDSLDRHVDVFQSNSSSLGLSQNLFEATLNIADGTFDNEHGVLVQNQTVANCSTGTCDEVGDNLYRFNVWHNISGGALGVDLPNYGPITDTRIVQDSFINVQRNIASVAYAVSFNANSTGNAVTGRIHNSLFYQAWSDNITTNVRAWFATGGGTTASADYNLAYDPDGSVTFTTPWTTQANELSNVDPVLTDVGNDDFTIGAAGGARNAGGPLTTTSGSGTGTTFSVASGGGGFFRGPNTSITTYGGNLTAGDVITVGSDTVTVVSISGDDLTVTPSFTWADAEPVYLGNDTTPDIGALPYRAGGYALTATYAIAGGTATITPNDADLVRFVICYGNGIPRMVDHASPFTCPMTQGFTARVYPRYASTTLWATATP